MLIKSTSRYLLPVLTLSLVLGPVDGVTAPTRAGADEFTISQDALRTGWDPHEPGLTPAEVSESQFGLRFSTPVDGQVYAQPLVVGGTVIAATERNRVYGIDAATGAVHWSKRLGTPWAAGNIGCGDLTPDIGVTGTPVYDPASGAVYLTAKVNHPDGAHPAWFLHALDPASGAERSGWPVRIHGAPTNDPGRHFDSFTAAQRPGLLLLDGRVYAGFASHCDKGPYVGYVVGVDTRTRAERLWATETSSARGEAGVWQSGGGLVSDGPGRIFLATGNGRTPPIGSGDHPPGQLSESVVRLGVAADGVMRARDFFSPVNAPTLDRNDGDLGSGGPLALPPVPFGAGRTHPHLLVEVGKDGRIFLLDRDHLGGRGQSDSGGDAVLGVTGPFQGVWGHPAAYGGNGGLVYEIGSRGRLRALAFGLDARGNPQLRSAGVSSESFGYTSGSPVVTSDGTAAGSATVWAEYADGSNGGRARLCAYDADPSGGRLRLLWSAPIGRAAKFAVPATSGGRVYVGTRDGRLLAFGLPASAALQGTSTDFGDLAVGSKRTVDIKVKATRTLTINRVSASGGSFTATPGGLPRTLTAGQTYSLPVTFTPGTPGTASGVLAFRTDVASLDLSLSGYGTRPGFTAFPSTLGFGSIPTGTTETLGVSFTNTGTAPERVTATTSPHAPFSAPGLAAADGMTVQPKQSVTIVVTYAPTAVSGGDAGSLALTGPDGTAGVLLSGSAVHGAAHLTITPTTRAFGAVRVDASRTLTFDIANTGNIPLTLTKAAPPAAPFLVGDPIGEGRVLAPGEVVHQAVTFSPTVTGTFSGAYLITGDDGRGPQNETFTGTGS